MRGRACCRECGDAARAHLVDNAKGRPRGDGQRHQARRLQRGGLCGHELVPRWCLHDAARNTRRHTHTNARTPGTHTHHKRLHPQVQNPQQAHTKHRQAAPPGPPAPRARRPPRTVDAPAAWPMTEPTKKMPPQTPITTGVASAAPFHLSSCGQTRARACVHACMHACNVHVIVYTWVYGWSCAYDSLYVCEQLCGCWGVHA